MNWKIDRQNGIARGLFFHLKFNNHGGIFQYTFFGIAPELCKENHSGLPEKL